MKNELCDIPFDFYNYYKGLTDVGQKTAFKYLVCQRLGVEKRQFEQWVQRRTLPISGSIQVQMIDIINDPNNHLPKIQK